jgi:hypothetical protein
MKNQLLTTCFLAAVALTPGLARAGDPAEKTVEAHALTDRAAALYDEGVVAFRKSKLAEARAAFLAAWALKQHWQIAANLADCELQLGRFRDAAEHAMYYAKNAPADRSDRAAQLFADASTKVATLRIDAQPDGTEILVDARSIGRAPMGEPVFLDPGEHTITARVPGRPDVVRKLSLLAGHSDKLQVRVDAAAVSLPPPPLRPPSEGLYVPALVTGGAVSGAGLIAGIVFTVVANGKSSDAASLRSALVSSSGPSACNAATVGSQTTEGKDCQEIVSLRGERDTFSNAAFWSFVGAGVVGAGTLVYALAGPRKKSAVGLQAFPVLSSAGGGMLVQGTW